MHKLHTPSFIGLGMPSRSAAYAIHDHKLGQKEFTRESPTMAPHLASVSNFGGTLQGGFGIQLVGTSPM
jgi:hypothetical protein